MPQQGHSRKADNAGWRTSRGLAGMLTTACLMALLAACVTTQNPTVSGPALPGTASGGAPPPPPVAPLPPPSLANGPRPVQDTPGGSLWTEASGSLFKDIKANKVGDILTITVSEESKASKEAQTDTSRAKDLSYAAKFSGMTTGSNKLVPSVDAGTLTGNFSNKTAGQGSTSKTDSMTAYMTATVVDVLPNGNLIIRGSRWTKVNNEMQQIILEGVVRPNDITRSNTVLSQNIADAKIFFEGKGPLTQHQKPGWLMQLFDKVTPF